MNHYQLLGVPRTADADQIRQAYINLCKQYEVTGEFEHQGASLKTASLAYKILSDADLRREYDESLISEGNNWQEKTALATTASQSSSDKKHIH
jgi:curved DNA-binding protein CbpA